MKKIKPKGRKIYKTKEKNYYGKTLGGRLISGCLTLVLIGGIGVIGFSVAGPLLKIERKTGDNAEDVIPKENYGEVIVTDYTEPVAVANETNTEPVIVNEETIKNFRQYRAAAVPDEAMADMDSLRAALERIPTDCNIEYAEIPLKISGGGILYSSTAYEAQDAGAKDAVLSVYDIVNTVQEYGFRPVAVINCFEDRCLPLLRPESGYTAGDENELWKSDEGLPQTSPCSDFTLGYNSYLINEAVSAGFERVVCTGLTIPSFSEYELENMDVKFRSLSERTAVIASAVNFMNETAVSGGAELIPEYSAAALINGEIRLPAQEILNTESIIINICLDEIEEIQESEKAEKSEEETTGEADGESSEKSAAEKISEILGLISGKTGDINTIIRISGSETGYEQLSEAKNAAESFGFSSFVIG